MLKSIILGAALLMSGAAMAGHHGGGHHGGNNGGQRQLVRCESNDYRYVSCGAWGVSRVSYVRIVQQHSKTSCIRGQNWRPTYSGVEVWGGCRGTFEVSGW